MGNCSHRHAELEAASIPHATLTLMMSGPATGAMSREDVLVKSVRYGAPARTYRHPAVSASKKNFRSDAT
jgi:hypothetical protein